MKTCLIILLLVGELALKALGWLVFAGLLYIVAQAITL